MSFIQRPTGFPRGSFLWLGGPMKSSRRAAIWMLLSVCIPFALIDMRSASDVRGLVRDEHGPVVGSQVRRQGSLKHALTDSQGMFCLRDESNRPLTAWKEGYRIASANGTSKPILLLSRLPEKDNSAYRWIAPDPHSGNKAACGNCHHTIHQEWSSSAHATAASNPRLLSLIHGTDTNGKVHAKWNLSQEHPLGVGVCSRCHAPTYQAIDLDYDLTKISGIAARGVHCDLCHKIVDVPTDKLGLRFGIDGLALLRPEQGDLLFYGPLPDAVRPGESFGHFPLYKESRYCASCHEGTVFGVKAYTTYSEWLDSPAARNGVQCQHCHMTPTGMMTNIAPGKGGIERDPNSLASHNMSGATGPMLKKSIRVDAKLNRAKEKVQVAVRIEARNVGHRVPTGFIDRHLVLLVQAWDKADKEMSISGGSLLPPRLGHPWTGKAGALFGRWLEGEAGNTPLPFWVPHEREFDTRLWPEKEEKRAFEFPAEAVRVQVRVIYRRFWPEVSEARGWNDDVIVFERELRP